ncbi:MAG: sigma-70 family RNA polymerase sigma factor [Deltaproteobacteria bacterium]|nr:sigma-70 family RNA polymerase sigma factor [Deltaproteobacteria bacterium]
MSAGPATGTSSPPPPGGPEAIDDAELARLKARDRQAQARFYAAFRERVEATCRRVLGAGPDAADIATDVLGDFLFQYVDGVESPRAVTTYLKLMATRRSLRWLRRGDKADEVSDEMPDAGDGPGHDQAIWVTQMTPRLGGCLEALTPKAREVLRLRFSTDMTNEVIGELLGGSKQYIGRLIKESTEKLKTCLERRGA